MNGIVEWLRRDIDVEKLIESGDLEKIKKVLLLKRGVLTPDEKSELIVATGDPDFMKACARDITLGLDKSNLVWVIIKTKDHAYIEKQARTMRFRKDSYYKTQLLRYTMDPERIEKYIHDKHIEIRDKCKLIRDVYTEAQIIEMLEKGEFKFSSDEKAVLIRRLSEKGKIACLKNPSIGLDVHDRGKMIEGLQQGFAKEEMIGTFFDVDKILGVSLEELEAMPEDGIVRIKSPKREERYDYYSKAEFIAIKKVTDKILEGIDAPEKGHEAGELAVFKKIYGRLAKQMTYDYAAIKHKNEQDIKWQRDCRNLYGLATGKTVCAGYACILVQMLEEMGMEAQYIRGDDGKTGHAWTQVKIGRKMV